MLDEDGRSADDGALIFDTDDGLFADEPGRWLADDGGRFTAAEAGLELGLEPYFRIITS